MSLVRNVSALARHWWAYGRGRLPAERSLRYSLAVGLLATTTVTALTYLAVALGPGVEANPLMRWLIDTHGWGWFAAVRYGVVLGVFALLWPFASMEGHWPDWSEGNGRLAAAVLVFNAVRDGVVFATGVTPALELLRLLGVV